MKNLLFFLLLLGLTFSNCTKEDQSDHFASQNISSTEIDLSPSATLKVSPKPCKAKTLDIANYGQNGMNYIDAILGEIQAYGSCVTQAFPTDFCGGNYSSGTPISSKLSLCRSHNYVSCTDEEGNSYYTPINPVTFNAEQYINDLLSQQESCAPGCVAVLTSAKAYMDDFLTCACGIGSDDDDGSRPCDIAALLAKKNSGIIIEVNYLCCCVGPVSGDTSY